MSAITDSAHLQDCLIQLPGVCCGDPETTVWCHSNRYKDGKGRSLKAHDHCGAYGCWKCHAVYDRQMPRPVGLTLEMVERAFTRAMAKSQKILIRRGLWDGKSLPQKIAKKIKSKKIQVVGQSALQRMCISAAVSIKGE